SARCFSRRPCRWRRSAAGSSTRGPRTRRRAAAPERPKGEDEDCRRRCLEAVEVRSPPAPVNFAASEALPSAALTPIGLETIPVLGHHRSSLPRAASSMAQPLTHIAAPVHESAPLAVARGRQLLVGTATAVLLTS